MKVIRDVVASLKRSRKLRISCPGCDRTIFLKDALLFTEDSLTEGALEFLDKEKQEIADLKLELAELKTKKLDRVQRGAKSSNLGKILERFVPILPGFMHKPEESVPLLDPIDYISFNGLSRSKIDSITFMDVKTGNAKLGDQQKSTRDSIEAGRVSIEYIRRGKK